VLVAAGLVVALGCLSAGTAQASRFREPPRMTCLLGSPETRSATASTLAGLDPVFRSVRVLEPPPPPLSSDHYSGPLYVWATLSGSRAQDAASHDLSGEWEAGLAEGAIAERCSRGLSDLPAAVVGDTVRYASGRHRLVDAGGGFAKAGLVLGTDLRGETDAEIVAGARRVLDDYGLTPRTVRVLHPLGRALLVEATARDVSTVRGRIPQLANALEGDDWGTHPQLEGLYLSIDGPDGPLVRAGNAVRHAGGFWWAARGFETGINHG
jgi:hypothetical protein